MQHRVFIAIPLGAELRQVIGSQLQQYQRRFRDEVRWIAPAYWHLTVLEPQQWEPEQIDAALECLREHLKTVHFTLRTGQIVPAPPGRARMVWCRFQAHTQFAALCRDVAKALHEHGIPFERNERQESLIHATIARSAPGALYGFTPLTLVHAMNVNSIELWESTLSRTGATYAPLGSIPLK